MFWWFERRGQYVRCEVRFPPTGTYELVTTDAAGEEHVEVFSNAAELWKRHEAVGRALAEEGWTGPHGWNI